MAHTTNIRCGPVFGGQVTQNDQASHKPSYTETIPLNREKRIFSHLNQRLIERHMGLILSEKFVKTAMPDSVLTSKGQASRFGYLSFHSLRLE